MQSDNPNHLILAIDDGQELDRGRRSFHLLHGVDGHGVWTDGSRVSVAHFPNRELEDGFSARLQSSTQIAVSECADQVMVVVDHKQAPAALARQLHQLLHYQISFLANRKLIFFLHHIFHLEDEMLADPTGGVIGGVLFLGEIFGAHECNRNGVAENHLNGGGGDRSQIEGAELSLQG